MRHELICELAHDLVHELVSHKVTLQFMRLIAFYILQNYTSAINLRF